MISELAWSLKNSFRYSPRLRRKPHCVDTKSYVASLPKHVMPRYEDLAHQYDLSAWSSSCTAGEYIENVYLLDVLQCYVGEIITENDNAAAGLDIGCRNFCHLPALHAFASLAWHGVEIDAYARYRNGYTRRAYGDFMTRQYAQAKYLPMSLFGVAGCYQFIVWLLPFLFIDTQRSWGLPSRFFDPEGMLFKAVSLLAPHGKMFIVNQGEAEAERQLQLLQSLGVNYRALGLLRSEFSPFKRERYGWLITVGGEE